MTENFYDKLAPFTSMTLAKANNVAPGDQLERCLTDIEAICAHSSG